jgi:hypothetical protein
MKAIVNFSKRTNRLKVLMALFTCLLFLIPPACEKLDPNQGSAPGMDEMVATPRAANTATKMYWGPRECGGGGNWEDWICPPWYENFGNFVLKVQNLSEAGAKISTLEIRISDVLILTAKGLSKDYFATKALRSLSNCAKIYIVMEGDQGSKIRVWVEATFKGLGTAFGKHLYYRSVQQIGNFNPDNFTPFINRFDMAREYCQWAGGHLIIINNAKENDFVRNLCNNGQYLIGLSDYQRESEWRWVDWNLCRVVIWNFTQCPNPNYPLNYGDRNCTVIQDYGYNNWGNNAPDNCEGYNCSEAQNVAVINNDGTWDDRNLDQINWISFVMEWDFIPNSTVIRDLFMREYPGYQYPW